MNYGWWSVVPPVAAILLAIATRRVVPSLLVGIVIGTLILKDWSAGWNPLSLLEDLLETHLWTSLAHEDHLRVFVFTALMGAMIGVIHRSGGMQAAVDGLAPLARTRRGGQLLTWALGLLIFIDDYANSLLLGNTMRPLTDRLKISREKLAYLVDSTAAPVSGLALISTWVAGEIGYIESGYQSLGLPGAPVDGFGVFVATIPYRFYVLFALLFVPLVALLGRDFGPMLSAERRRANGPDPGHQPDGDAATGGKADAPNSVVPVGRRRWLDAVIPILVTVGVTVALLIVTGWRATAEGPSTEPAADVPAWRAAIAVVGAGDSYLSLVYGSLAGLLTAVSMATLRGTLTGTAARSAAFDGARLVIPALTILWLAWSLSGITGKEYLGTGEFLGSLLQQKVDVRWMPTLVFLLASFVSFSTGTSWGTMGILMPIVVNATYHMMVAQTGHVDPTQPLLIASIGSVLAGAIFGDHCSPISDTTVLSSQASGCNHVAHVWTQLPYALAVAGVSIVFGTLPVGFGFSPGLLLVGGSVALVVVILVLGRRVDEYRATPKNG